jgi:hypothetical protein
MAMLTYRDILNQLSKFPEDMLDDTATVHVSDDEFFGIRCLGKSNDNGTLDDGHIYFSIDEELCEDDEEIVF